MSMKGVTMPRVTWRHVHDHLYAAEREISTGAQLLANDASLFSPLEGLTSGILNDAYDERHAVLEIVQGNEVLSGEDIEAMRERVLAMIDQLNEMLVSSAKVHETRSYRFAASARDSLVVARALMEFAPRKKGHRS